MKVLTTAMRESRITCAGQDGCLIAGREVSIGMTRRVARTCRASAVVTRGSARLALSRADSLTLYMGPSGSGPESARAYKPCSGVPAEKRGWLEARRATTFFMSTRTASPGSGLGKWVGPMNVAFCEVWAVCMNEIYSTKWCKMQLSGR